VVSVMKPACIPAHSLWESEGLCSMAHLQLRWSSVDADLATDTGLVLVNALCSALLSKQQATYYMFFTVIG
jgi:hypothetical protein